MGEVDDFDGLLDDMSDMDGCIGMGGSAVDDLDHELAALCDIGSDLVIPLMDGTVTGASPSGAGVVDAARRMAQPALHTSIGHYARNVKTGAKASMPKVGKSPACGKVETTAGAGAVKAKATPNKKGGAFLHDSLKKFQSRAFQQAGRDARGQGLDHDGLVKARQTAYRNATAEWNARLAKMNNDEVKLLMK